MRDTLNMGYEIVRGPAFNASDISEFIETLDGLDVHPDPRLHNFFNKQDLTVTRAPGRLDVMGGIADYSGSLVLELPIAEATFVALQKDDSRQLSIASLLAGGKVITFQMPLDALESDGEPLSYADAQRYFKIEPGKHWAAYVAGVFLVLMRDRGTRFRHGARLLISSRVPEGKGVSSSAALEVATMSAVAAAFDLEIPGRELALLCQRVENLIVGAPCGVMDQMTSACGEENQLLALVCQPAELLGTIKLPEDLALWGLDSGVRHSVGGGDYGSVRAGTFMGYRIIAELAGLSVDETGNVVAVDDSRWGGYLANLPPSEFQDRFANNLPATMSGSEFLARYGGTTDAVTQVDPQRIYQVHAPVAHAVYENSRVHRFADLLRRGRPLAKEEKKALGELMYESHASYSACGLGSQATDDLVELVRTAGVDQGLFGAKITGGGSGGMVAVLGDAAASPAVMNVSQRFSELSGKQSYVFSGSSPGSASFGHLVLRRISDE
jgi:galactokinase